MNDDHQTRAHEPPARGQRPARSQNRRRCTTGLICLALILCGMAMRSMWSDRRATTDTTPSPPSRAALMHLDYHALVIGINAYRNGWHKLQNARHDAESVARVLTNQYGFSSVVLLLDEEATQERILHELEGMQELDVNDALLIYFAGHGAAYPSLAGEEGFWIPADASHLSRNPQAKAGWLWNSLMFNFLEASDARHILVVADSCYAGSIFQATHVRTDGVAMPYAQLLDRPSRYVIASGGAGEIVYDSGRNHSPFAQYFLHFLGTTTNQRFSASELADAIRPPYRAHTGNTMRSGPLLRQQKGEFVFVRSTAPDAHEGFPLDPDPEYLLSQNALDGVVALQRSGHSGTAGKLLDKIPEPTRTGTLGQAVAAQIDPAKEEEQARRLHELIAYIDNRDSPPDPDLENALRAFAQPRILVVLGPQDRTTTKRGETAAQVWRYGLSGTLGAARGLRIVDRKNLEDLLTELTISDTRLSDERTRSLIGSVLPASLVLTGEYFEEGQSERVFLRLLATDTSEVLGSFEAATPPGSNRGNTIAGIAQTIHTRALSQRPIFAKVLEGEDHILKAAAGRFHGVHAGAEFELLYRTRQESVLFEEYRDRRVGTARLSYLGENTIDLEPAWEEEVPLEQYEHLWVRELVGSGSSGG